MILFGFRPSVWLGRILQPSTVPHVWSIAKMRLPEEHVDGKKGPKLSFYILHSCMRSICVIQNPCGQMEDVTLCFKMS